MKDMLGEGEKRKIKRAKDKRCFEENEDYYLNRRMVKSSTEGMVYYFQRVEGVIVKTEITENQWKNLYSFNRKCLRKSQDYYDEDYWSRMPEFFDEDGEEDDPMEHFADFGSRFCEADNIERMDRETLLSKMTKLGRRLYHLYYEKKLRQDEIAQILRVKQYRVSRWLRELDEAIGKELLDDGERSKTEIEVDYIYNRYRRTGKLEHYEDVAFEDFLSNLKPWEEERLRLWFYNEKEIERRAERFTRPKELTHEAFIGELTEISRKARMTPEEYFDKRFMPYYRERTAKKQMEFAAKELGFIITKESDSRPIPKQIEAVIAKLPSKERKRWQKLKAE